MLDGSVAGQSDNVLVYATSNRRHLMPEMMSENLEAKYQEDGEIHPGETSEEKISLSERFGLWIAFYPFRQDDYLAVVGHWLAYFGANEKDVARARGDALRWALERGSRSGRVAWQFARDWAGHHVKRRARLAEPVMLTDRVAVGVVFRDDGAVLIGQRLEGKPYAGWWEFPGGKFEAGEDAAEALARELDEELGIAGAGVAALGRSRTRLRACPRAAALPAGGSLARHGQVARGPGLRLAPPVCDRREPPAAGGDRADPLAGPAGGVCDIRCRRRWASRPSWTASPAGCRTTRTPLRLLQLREPAMAAQAFEALFDGACSLVRGTGARLLVSSRHPQRYLEPGGRTQRGRGPLHRSRPGGCRLTRAAAFDCPWWLPRATTAADLTLAGVFGADLVVLRSSQCDGQPPAGESIGVARL